MIENHSTAKELKAAAPYIITYTFFCSCIYLYIFWSKFNINPLPYISFNEIITNSSSLLWPSTIFAVLILISEAIFPSKSRETTPESNAKNLIYGFSIGALAVLAFLVWHEKFDALQPIAFSTMIVCARPLSQTSFFLTAFSNASIRTAIASYFIFLPVSSVIFSTTEAANIRKDSKEHTIIIRPQGLCSDSCIFVGKLGDYFAILNKNNLITIIKSDEMKQFTILHH